MAISDQHPVSIQKEPKILNFKKKLQEDVTQQNPHSISAGYEFEKPACSFSIPWKMQWMNNHFHHQNQKEKINNVFFYVVDVILLRATKGARRHFLVSGTLKAVWRSFPKTVHLLAMLLLYRLTRMVWGREGRGVEYKVRLMSQLSRECTCTWCNNHCSTRKHTWFVSTSTVSIMRLFDSPCRPGIYLPRKMNVEADLSLVREEC